MVEIKILGPRSEVDDALREMLYGSSKFTINRVVDPPLEDLAIGEREITLDYPRPR